MALMRFKGFIGPSYTLQSLNVDCQRCVNLYPEMDEIGTGNEGEVAALIGTPGLKLLVALPTGPVRGTYTDSTGQLWAVGGNVLYQVSSSWTATAIGTLSTLTGPVSMSDNGLVLVVVDGPFGYTYIYSSEAFAEITDPNFLGATQVDFLDGFFIFAKPSSKEFYLSPLNWNGTDAFDALDAYSAEARPENMAGLIELQENIYVLSGNHMEVWYDAGGAVGSTLARIQGSVIEVGCSAAFSIAKIQNSVYWLGQDQNGRGIVYRAEGLQPQRVSTLAIEKVIRELGDLSSARAWVYEQAGHSFYCLNLPGATSTWVFDTTTNLWHERAHFGAGQYQRHLADCHAYAYQTNVVGDYSSGNLYALDPETFTDNGNPLVWERTAPHLSKDKNRIFHSAFQADMEMGVGTDGTGQGISPQIMLQWSDDYGNKWSNERLASIGGIGARHTRAIFRRLGQSRDRVYRLRGSDPVKRALLGAQIDMEEGAA